MNWHPTRRTAALLAVAALLVLAGCSGPGGDGTATPTETTVAATDDGGNATATDELTTVDDGAENGTDGNRTTASPTGNATET